MKTRISTTIEAGDLVHHHGRLWIAEAFDPSRPCDIQCAMSDGEGRCCGYCWRWDNGEGFVFRYLLPDTCVKDATEVVQTPDPMEDMLLHSDDTVANSKNRYYYEKVKRMRDQRAVRPYGTGNLAPNRGGWRGEIYVGGERFVKYDTDKAVVLAWLDEMNAKKQALAKMDKLKGRKR